MISFAEAPSAAGHVVDIVNGKLVVADATPEALSLDGLQVAVGGYIERALEIASVYRRNTFITVWVDEEGLLKGKPLTFAMYTSEMGVAGPFVGNARIVATQNGASVPLIAVEVQCIRLLGIYPAVILDPDDESELETTEISILTVGV